MSDNKTMVGEKELTPRQRNLLFTVIKEYCDFGEGIGSKEIQSKYNFGISPATIRNEFIKLRDYGYLYQSFTNAPSIPTEKAFKLFVNQLILGLQATNQNQMELRKHILDLQKQQVNLNKEISRLLATQAGAVGFSLDQNSETVTGISNLLQAQGEGKVSDILDFLDNLDHYKKPLLESSEQLFLSVENGINSKDFKTVFGGENPVIPLGKGYALVATEVYVENEKTVVGIIAPTHLVARSQNIELVSNLSKALSKKKVKK